MGIPERWKGRAALRADIAERLDDLTPLFERSGVLLAYLFGSLARGAPAEDVDLAVLQENGDTMDLWSAIAEILGTDRLDLVALDQAEPVLRFAIISEGRLIYRASEEGENEFELAATREYRDTRYLRRIQNEYLAERDRR